MSRVVNTYYVSQIVTRTSRIRGFRASAFAARGAEETAAPPAPRNRLYRIACQLIDKENFDHGRVRRPLPERWGGILERECRPHRISHAVFSQSLRSRVLDSARRPARCRLAGGCRRRR